MFLLVSEILLILTSIFVVGLLGFFIIVPDIPVEVVNTSMGNLVNSDYSKWLYFIMGGLVVSVVTVGILY